MRVPRLRPTVRPRPGDGPLARSPGPGLAAALAAAAQDPGLAAGIRQVDEGDFEGAVATLGPVADRLAAKGGHDAAQACLYLGIAQLALDQRDAARARFREALGHEPSLRLGPDRFSPKVIAAFEDARREREAETRAAAPEAKPEAGKGHTGRTASPGGAPRPSAGVGILYAVGQGDTNPPGDGQVTFTGARFGTPVLDCPNGTTGTPLAVAIDLTAQNDTGARRDARRGLRHPLHRRVAGGAGRGGLREHRTRHGRSLHAAAGHDHPPRADDPHLRERRGRRVPLQRVEGPRHPHRRRRADRRDGRHDAGQPALSRSRLELRTRRSPSIT